MKLTFLGCVLLTFLIMAVAAGLLYLHERYSIAKYFIIPALLTAGIFVVGFSLRHDE
jgi:hypothetical protein